MKVLVILADGFEEIEAFTVIDVLRRGGVDVVTAGIVSSVVEGAHKIKTIADKRLHDINTAHFKALILPGGDPGYKNLMNSQSVINLVKEFNEKKKYIAAICAAPLVLAKAGVLEDKIATVYPGFESMLPRPRDAKVIVDHNIITAKSPATAMLFALKLLEIFTNKKTARLINDKLGME